MLEVADIFRRHGEAFRRSRGAHLGRIERRVMAAIEGKREPNSTFPGAGVTAMLGSMIEMGDWGDERGVVRGS